VPKHNVPQAELQVDFGIVGDAHAGSGLRQVSLLDLESIAALQAQGADIAPGDFAENLTVEGLNLSALSVGQRLRIGDTVELEVTQLGKRCHGRCRIFEKLGDCIMPRQGVFARVTAPGQIRPGDAVTVHTGHSHTPQAIKAAILTVSDRCSQGHRVDASGPALREILTAGGYEIGGASLVPDDRDAIVRELTRFADEGGCDLVFTTGGTGLGPRDVTPEATLLVCDRVVPGLGELIRAQSLKKTPHAALSRGTAGLRGRTLIVNLPGSPKAVRECLEAILEVLPHAVAMLRGGGHGD